jgi:NAD+ synthase
MSVESVAASIGQLLRLDSVAETERICLILRDLTTGTLRRRGVVVAMSGGVDSSVCAGIAVRALGPERVFGLLLPERESHGDDLQLAQQWAEVLGISHDVVDITAVLEACGAYHARDRAVQSLIPEFGEGWTSKITVEGSRYHRDGLTVFFVSACSPDGEVKRVRLTASAYREIVAATNYKQRVRKMIEYHGADRLHYAVVGTPNRLEYDQGFFVKGGDGLADVKPIAHLYKTQVYQLAAALGVPTAITGRPPTTGTYSMEQTQEEFFFGMPLQVMDVLLFAYNQGIPPDRAAAELSLDVGTVEFAFRDIAQRRKTTSYLHRHGLTISPIAEID